MSEYALFQRLLAKTPHASADSLGLLFAITLAQISIQSSFARAISDTVLIKV